MFCQRLLFMLSAATALPWDEVPPGHISFKQEGVCGTGEPSFVGMIQPMELLHPDQIFIEIMGGAICFNRASCNSADLGVRTMGIQGFLKNVLKTPQVMIDYLASGAAINLGILQSMNPGFIPYPGTGHPLEGRRGLFLISCTGDVNLGRHVVTYPPYKLTPPLTTCDETMRGEVPGMDYVGCRNYTKSGIPCQNWNSSTPHKQEQMLHSRAVDRGIGDHNYCRNPDGEPGIWCYTTNPAVRWDYCSPVGVGDGQTVAHHVGAKNMALAIKALKCDIPSVTDVVVYGSSGGGVSSVAWAPVVADVFFNAQVTTVADSSLHVFPGTKLFQHFYDEAIWGPGPAGLGAGFDDQTAVGPDFDWRVLDAVAAQIASFDGRLKVAYFSCIDDHIVYSDRLKMAMYAGLKETKEELENRYNQHEDAFKYLANMEKCSPPGTAFSFIQNCSHHATHGMDSDKVPAINGMSAWQFTKQVFLGLPPNESNATQSRWWYAGNNFSGDAGACVSPVRRRRGVADALGPAPAPPNLGSCGSGKSGAGSVGTGTDSTEVKTSGNFEIKMSKEDATKMTNPELLNAKEALAKALRKTLVSCDDCSVAITAIYVDGVKVGRRLDTDSKIKVDWEVTSSKAIASDAIATDTLKTNIQNEAKAKGVTIIIKEVPVVKFSSVKDTTTTKKQSGWNYDTDTVTSTTTNLPEEGTTSKAENIASMSCSLLLSPVALSLVALWLDK